MLSPPPAPGVLTAKGAIARHMQWRMTFQMAIVRKEPLPEDQLDQIRHDSHCAIGRWLTSVAATRIGKEQAFGDLVTKHFKFHRSMEIVAKLITQQRFQDAEQAIAAGSPFDQASQQIAHAIMAVDRIQAIVIPASFP